MPTYTFTYMDASLSPLASLSPEIEFYLNKESTITGGWLISDRPVKGVLFPDGTGYVNLVSNDQIDGNSFYTARAIYLNGAGKKVGRDVWKFYARLAGGPISNMVDISSFAPARLIVSNTEPDPWPVGWVWANPLTGDVKRRVA